MRNLILVLSLFIGANAVAKTGGDVGSMSTFESQRAVLVQQLSEAEAVFTDSDYSADPNSQYQQAANRLKQTLIQLKTLATQGIRN